MPVIPENLPPKTPPKTHKKGVSSKPCSLWNSSNLLVFGPTWNPPNTWVPNFHPPPEVLCVWQKSYHHISPPMGNPQKKNTWPFWPSHRYWQHLRAWRMSGFFQISVSKMWGFSLHFVYFFLWVSHKIEGWRFQSLPISGKKTWIPHDLLGKKFFYILHELRSLNSAYNMTFNHLHPNSSPSAKASWWVWLVVESPIWKNMLVKMDSSYPIFGVKIPNMVWNHDLVVNFDCKFGGLESGVLGFELGT